MGYERSLFILVWKKTTSVWRIENSTQQRVHTNHFCILAKRNNRMLMNGEIFLKRNKFK